MITFTLFLVGEDLPKTQDISSRKAGGDKARADLKKTGRAVPAFFEPVSAALCEGA